ncbi:hypothetical protein RMN56_21935 [Micromonospora halotolerans]|uniref:Uncharacterized protein n=1 Tax=Micromonospora halotolerans TaxID=709879 RepID=A0ABY9ZRD5_9ACTN|nr:hypothetical protein [Micromonospora halotolerans]WNM37799.1 hypothetical protein RMN56_21935 [Micromonospora halotolerans]
MFKNAWAGTWLLIGLVGSVLLRGILWLLTLFSLGPLLGPVDLLLFDAAGHTVATAISVGDAVASFLCAIATGVACVGLRGDRAWAYRLGRWLARFYVAVNTATATACGVLVAMWGRSAGGLVTFLFVLYVVSLGVAVMAVRQLAAPRSTPDEAGTPESSDPV